MFYYASLSVLRFVGALSIGILFCLLPAKVPAATAAPCTLQWGASPDPAVRGYALYYWLTGGSTTYRLDAGTATSATLYTLSANSNYFFYVVAYDAVGIESPRSNVVTYSPPVLSSARLTRLSDGSMRIRFGAAPGSLCRVECSTTLSPPQWTTLGSALADAWGVVTVIDPPTGRPPTRFYRGVKP